MSLAETMREFLTDSQKATVDEMYSYVWFRAENKLKFLAALEPLAYSVKLELRHQIQSYYSAAEKTYFDDLLLKTSHLLKELHLDGSILEIYDSITSLGDLNMILPEKALDVIDRLSQEGFAARDFAVATHYCYFCLVLRAGPAWLSVMTLERKGY